MLKIAMPDLHRRIPHPAALNMEHLTSEAPLLSPTSRSSSSGESDSGPPTNSYGSVPIKDSNSIVLDFSPIDEERCIPGPQGGVQQADAINQVWSRAALITAYSFILLVSFANALQWQVMSNLMPYVVSEFSSHSLIPTIGIVASIMSGVLKLPVAKMIDSWGRPQGLAMMISLATFGLILMALCQNVKTYAASQVIYQVGISGFSYVLDIIIADTSSLRNRTLAFAFNSSPNLITTFIGPVIARAFYERSSWRWAFGTSAVLFFMLSLPVLSILVLNTRRARIMGLLPKTSKAGPWNMNRVRRSLVDIDATGMFLMTAGLTLILVPLSLSGSTETTHRGLHSTSTSLLIGILSLILFIFHERRTERPLLKFSLLFSRNVAGACLLSIAIFVAYFAWDGYYTSYLQVVHDLTITEAGYVGHIYGIGSCIWTVVVGYLIRRSDRFKWIAVAALPVHLLGGLFLIIFRRPDTNLAWIIMSQILITIGGSTLVVCEQMAVMSVATHAELASALALLSLASYIGSAMGSSLSGAIWNTTLPEALAELLPEMSPGELASIGSDLKKQLSYPMGSHVRSAIIVAYDRSQVRMCVAGMLVSLLEIVAVLLWKDVRVSQSKQVKGTVL
ncbi:MFS general substrate transporter [Xylariomycetidae sp. FL2044]|nr:MFS general substrate transporter [Xylariomycetidae sp. FL2044]